MPRVVKTTSELRSVCETYSAASYVTVDTEFLRERTYWPVLCLVQIARPQFEGESESDWERDSAVLIDPLADGIDLEPLFALMADPSILKVFHAARQDVEIFHHLSGKVPAPLFDTQVAAMVCGFGDQVGYERLVRSIVGASLDKSSRFTDWAKRPLSDQQLTYAIGDVTHLRVIYEELSRRLDKAGRAGWLTEEMAVLNATDTYETQPEDAWKRLKMRSPSAKVFAVACALAQWREGEAQRRDVPRSRVLKDDALMEIAAARPTTAEGVTSGRMSRRESLSREAVQEILNLIRDASNSKPPPRPKESAKPNASQYALADLLKTLLKANAAKADVAERLIAPSADLERIAIDAEPDVAALRGWRREVFGEDALRLKRGELALSAGPHGVEVIDIAALRQEDRLETGAILP